MTEIAVTESDNGGRITASVGDVIDIRLAENATTGYRWVLEQPQSAVLTLQTSGSDYPDRKLGSSGQASFRVGVSGPGTETLRLVYQRPWDSGATGQRGFSVEVTVAPA
jgi:inhibitor of cysteine peptidase